MDPRRLAARATAEDGRFACGTADTATPTQRDWYFGLRLECPVRLLTLRSTKALPQTRDAPEPTWLSGGLNPGPYREIGNSLPNNQHQHRTSHIQKDVLPCALC